MRACILTCVFFILIGHVIAQVPLKAFYDIEACAYGFKNIEGEIIIEPLFKSIKGFTKDGVCQVKLNEKWGLINKSGEFLIEPTLDELWNFHPKYVACPAKKNKRWGFIDRQGNWLISPRYKNLSYAQKGYFEKPPFLFIVQKNGLNGIVSSSGKEVVGTKYDRISEKFNNYGITKVVHNDKYGLIDSSGKTVLDINYTYLERNYHDLEIPYLLTTKSSKMLLCSPRGKILNTRQLENIEVFSKHYKNLSYTLFKDGSQCGLINENGEIYAVDNAKPLKPFNSLPLLLISEQNELLCLDPRESKSAMPIMSYSKKDAHLSYLKDEHTLLFKSKKNDPKHLLIDEYGRLIHSGFLWNWTEEKIGMDGVHYYCQDQNKQYGLYIFNNKRPNIWIEPSFDDISAFDPKLRVRWIKKDGHIGAINAVGEILFDPEFEDIKHLYASEKSFFYILKKDGYYALFNENHIQLSPFSYNNIWSHSDKIFALNKSTLPEFIPDLKKPKFIPYHKLNTKLSNSDSILVNINKNHSTNQMFLFVENGKYGLMNQSAELIEAPVFEEIRHFQNPYHFDDIYAFKAHQIKNHNIPQKRILAYNYVFEKNIKANMGSFNKLSEQHQNQEQKSIFFEELKIDNEFRSFEANNQELHFKRFFLENIFGDFFTLKVKHETQIGQSTRLNESFESFYIKNSEVFKIGLKDIFRDNPQHTTDLSKLALQKLRELRGFELTYCANENAFINNKEYFVLKKDGLLFHFRDQRNLGSGLWKDRQYSGADIFISYRSIGHLISEGSLLYPLYKAQLK